LSFILLHLCEYVQTHFIYICVQVRLTPTYIKVKCTCQCQGVDGMDKFAHRKFRGGYCLKNFFRG